MAQKPTYEELEKRIQELEQVESVNKKPGEVLQMSKYYLSDIINTIGDPVFVKDDEFRFVLANDALCKILGIEQENIIGKTLGESLPDDQMKHFLKIDKLVLESGQENMCEEILTGGDGNILTIITKKTRYVDEQGRRFIVGTIRDITERKRTENALIESKSILEASQASMMDAIFIADNYGELVEMNEAWASFCRFQNKGECLKQLTDYPDLFEVFDTDGEFVPMEKWVLPRALRGESMVNAEYNIRRKDTGETWVGAYSFSPIRNDQGVIDGAVVVARDVTELKQQEQVRRQLEAQLQQSQKMESIGNLAGGIAHDFNNILSSVIGFTELSLGEVEKDSVLEDNLQEVYSAGKRAKELVNQILAFARQSDAEIKPTQPSIIAKEVLKLIRSSIPTTIEIKQTIESESFVLGNPTQIHQIFMNLFTNAAYAMEDNGGLLELSMKDVCITPASNRKKASLKAGDYIHIKVSDTGTGISPENIHSIFEPYFTTKGPGEGTGMGLAMVQGIIEIYGGKIAVDSNLGKGSTFNLYLPVSKNRKSDYSYKPEALPIGTERILFVDDEVPITKMGKRILEELGYSVETRTSSVEALELFQSKPKDFDLIISDMTMPNLTGDNLATEMMKIRSDIPVILCTGYSKKVTDKKASEIGIKAFAYKPIVKADLVKIVRKVLDEAKS